MARILIVEDNEMNRDMLSRRLARAGHEIVLATDGAEGIARAQEIAPDLILMDLDLPIVNGWDAARTIRKDSRTSQIPIIALTAHAMTGEREKALAAGCDDYDTKPVVLTRLLQKIDGLLARRAAKTPSAAPVAPPAASPATVRDKRYHVLVVDDMEINRDLLRRRLERKGYRCTMAYTGQEALDCLRRESFDLVLLDIMMPEMSGYEVLERIKSHDDWRHIPVIMISALDDLASVVTCIEQGAEDYLPKPFDPVLLQARIGSCLEKKRLRDQEIEYRREIERERNRNEELLRVILPPSVVSELKTRGQVASRRYEGVAVLFCDIVGFTDYCARTDAEVVVCNLQQCVEAFEELAIKYQLQKIKTIGDSFMATAGLLDDLPNPVLRCVRGALDMHAAVATLPAGWQVRCGIHYGPVIAGVVGRRQFLFDIWGDTVNTAARVESNGRNGAVNLSREAWEEVATCCQGGSIGVVEAKGKGEIELFVVTACTTSASPTNAP